MSATEAGSSVLVTGGRGFIGAWLVQRLLDLGARVLVPKRAGDIVTRFDQAGLAARCDLVEVNLLDAASPERVLNEYDVDRIFHLAAQTIIGKANRSPFQTFETNVRGTYNLLEACRRHAARSRAPRVVVASSYHLYGAHGDVPYKEDFELRPVHPYDVSKACADMIARSYAITYDLPVAVVRLANVYGGGDLNFSRLVPSAARALIAGERPVLRSSGAPERDYLHVDDAVDAYLAVADSLARPTLRGRAWNAGGGRPTPVIDVVRGLIAVSGRAVEPELRGMPDERPEVDRQWLDSGALRAELGWSPRWDLESGLESAYRWYRHNQSLANGPAPD